MGWWQGIPPGQALVRCNGHEHQLRWEEGGLRAADHEDVDGERALAALAGQSCACLDALDAWERRAQDLRVFVLASRGPTDALAAPGDPGRGPHGAPVRSTIAPAGSAVGRVQIFSTVGRASGGARAAVVWESAAGRLSRDARAEHDLLNLIRLGGGLPERLTATVAAHWRDALREAQAPPARQRAQLHAALHGRAFESLRGWLRVSNAETRLTMIAEDATPELHAEDGYLALQLPFGWLVDVWARGFAVIAGRFCLAARSEDDGRTWQLTTVGPDLGPPATVTVVLPEG